MVCTEYNFAPVLIPGINYRTILYLVCYIHLGSVALGYDLCYLQFYLQLKIYM